MRANELMDLPIWQWQIGDGRCKVLLSITDTGHGLNGLLTGGERPHVGGMVLALPRPSLSGEGWSTDVYITPVPGHKDVEVARKVAETLASELQITVAITAGIHSDNISTEELREIVNNCDSLTQTALTSINSLKKVEQNLHNE